MLALAVWLQGATALAQGQALALEGVDEIEALSPAAATVTPYENSGYRLWLEGDVVRVRVDNAHLESTAPFEPIAPRRDDPVGALAASLTAHSDTVYDAATEVLIWVARSIRYDLNRSQDQAPAAVLERRSGYCTGIAKLTVSLLRAAGLEAREVAGYVFANRAGSVEGYHRWVEIYYPDRGWAFSDPTSSHHFVPATYVRLASSELDLTQPRDGLLLGRSMRLEARDVYPRAPTLVRARKNTDRQIAGALRVTVEGAAHGTASLIRGGSVLRSRLEAGSASFTGLRPGTYRLRVKLRGGEVLSRSLRLRKKIRADVTVRASLPPVRLGG